MATFSPFPFPALVVEPNESERVAMISTLTSAGFTVHATDNYRDAVAILAARPPLVIVTEVRLAAFNGLQLAMRATAANPRVTVIVVSSCADTVIQHDAESVGVTFALKPIPERELMAAIYRTALRRRNADGVLEPVRAPFERRDYRVTHGDPNNAPISLPVQSERRVDIGSLLRRAASMS
jgi:DNA-binding NtrC family response regulator